MNETTKLISIKDASNLLGVTPLTLRNWDKNGKLKASRHPMNNYRVYKREDIERLIKEIGENTKPVETRKKKITKKLEVRHLAE
jgi:DNA (cytosine-5)-methyltransferase 1